MTLVLDASAVLAFLGDEPGAERVKQALNGAAVSAVNWAEVVQISLRRQVDVTGMREEFSDIGVVFEPFTVAQAEIAAHVWGKTYHQGLSLADHACLALAIQRKAAVLTADRAWGETGLDVEIQFVR